MAEAKLTESGDGAATDRAVKNLVAQVPGRAMIELTQQQMQTMERLFEAGFRPIAIPPYENALCVHRGDCAAVLSPIPSDGLKLLAPPTYLVAGNLSVRLKRGAAEVFVWKKTELPATAERLKELEGFREDLTRLLDADKQ